MKKFIISFFAFTVLSFCLPFIASADTLISGTCLTDDTVISGSINDLCDNNTGTSVQVVQSSNPNYFWFYEDLGSVQDITHVDLVDWCEDSGTDSSFVLKYSNSPLNSGNIGTDYGSSESAVDCGSGTATKTVTAGITARYIGFYRTGNFNSQFIQAADLNVFGPDAATSTPTATSTPFVSGTINNPNQDIFNGIVLFLMVFVIIIWLIRK